MIGHILWELANWPNGIVVGNLIASVIWSAVFEWRLRVHHKNTTDKHNEVVAELTGQVKELSAKLKSLIGGNNDGE